MQAKHQSLKSKQNPKYLAKGSSLCVCLHTDSLRPFFSGKTGVKFWDAVNRSKDKDILYDYGCKAQEIEAINVELLAACENFVKSAILGIAIVILNDKGGHEQGIAIILKEFQEQAIAAIANAQSSTSVEPSKNEESMHK